MTTESFDWLPNLITLAEYEGSWPKYLKAIYAVFHRDFIASKPTYPAKRFGMKRYPEYDGKEATFWHLISEGEIEGERTPDMRRCERIAWPRPIVDAIGTDSVRIWKNIRGRNQRILLAVEDFSYVVVLDERDDFVLLWTAFHVEYANKRRKYQRECEQWQKENSP